MPSENSKIDDNRRHTLMGVTDDANSFLKRLLVDPTTGALKCTAVLANVTVSGGGTGLTSLTPYAVLTGGTTATGAMQQVSGLGTAGYVLTSNGAGALPTWQATAAAGANTALSNLASVAINAALIPGTAGALDVGSTTKPWADLWIAGTSGTPGTNQFKITGASTGGLRTMTLPDKSGTFAMTSDIGSSEVLWLTGVSFPKVFGNGLPQGNNDLYTVPANKRALILGARIYNASAGSITYNAQIKVSGTYYRIGADNTLTTGTGSNGTPGTNGWIGSPIVLEAGEILSINTTTTDGLNVVCSVILFDDSCSLKTTKILSLSNGDNTLYTVPVGKTSLLYFSIFAPTGNNQGINVINNSGGSLNYTPYVVPSGGSAGTTNQMYAATAIGDKGSSIFVANATLSAGDFIVLNTSAGTATQTAWITHYEV